jgi:NTP pyrophosphatase (non-canonical NTP hydrolase)
MTNEEYIKSVLRSESPNFYDISERLLHAALGIQTESGEFSDIIKKSLFYGRTYDRPNAKEELGDLLWYIAFAIDELGTTFEEVMELNIAKLKLRYPEQFTEEHAENRNLEEERNILEKVEKEALGTTLLEVQQECIRLRKQVDFYKNQNG